MQALQPELPSSFAATREALHRVAEELVAPARKPHNEISLRQTPGGFGTPPFELSGQELQVRVDGAELVVTRDGEPERIPLTSLGDAGARLGPDLLPDGGPKDGAPLAIDPEAAARLADFYAFADEVLAAVRSGLPSDADVSDVNLWPEHFDLAFEAGSEAAGQRANLGASPGDPEHPEPYLYVGPWTAEVEGELWNATGFNGAELPYADLAAPGDQAARAVGFFRTRLEALSRA
jgi:hypothetical protein